MSTKLVKEQIRFRGVPVLVDTVSVLERTFIVNGNLLRVASLKNEWQEDVEDPARTVRALKKAAARIDILKFWQRVPESEAKFSYYKEWRDIAAIPISTFDCWWKEQISPKVRNKVRKAQKLGVVTKQVSLDDELVRGIMGVFNDSPVRRGKRFWHYGRDFDSVKDGMQADLNESVFVATYYKEELIGFIKFIVTDRFAMTSLILDKQSHRDKAPMNAMIAKVVEICAERGIPYFTYTVWRKGDHGKFQESNGFTRIPVPEYFIPLTLRGRLALSLRLHKGLKEALPKKLMTSLLDLRAKWYARKYGLPTFSTSSTQKSVSASSV